MWRIILSEIVFFFVFVPDVDYRVCVAEAYVWKFFRGSGCGV